MLTFARVLPAVILVALAGVLAGAIHNQQLRSAACNTDCIGRGYEAGRHSAEGCECTVALERAATAANRASAVHPASGSTSLAGEVEQR